MEDTDENRDRREKRGRRKENREASSGNAE